MEPEEFAQLLTKYADLIVRVGVNIQTGQRLRLAAGIQDAVLAREIAKAAYRAGASYVDPQWSDDPMLRLRLEGASPESLGFVPDWQLAAQMEFTSPNDTAMALYADDPDLLQGIDPERIDAWRTPRLEKFKPAREFTRRNAISWCLASGASAAWAHKVFPMLGQDEAQARLWEAIFRACRVYEPDPVRAWEEHLAQLSARREYLNQRRYSALHLTGPGTDLTIGLPVGHQWEGGGGCKSLAGVEFVPNLPTEEVFTLPHRERVSGYVSSTLPLLLQGSLVEDFTLKVENGCVVKARARTGEEILLRALRTDEGSSHFGEIALVPNSSPISQMKLLFYNGLYDENAACHIALGTGLKFSLDGGAAMSDEEFLAAGGNCSLIHEDFMVGSAHMDVDGIRPDGTAEPILRGGEWTFAI